MHHVDRGVLWEEIFPVFQGMIQNGDIDYLASSNFAGWNIADAQGEAKKSHMFGLVCEQHKYNLLTRIPELEVLPSAKSHGMGIVAWSPLEGGMLSRNAMNRKDVARGMQEKLEKFHELCLEIGEEEDVVALAWLLQNPAVTAPIIGPRTVGQLYDALRALEIHLEQETIERLEHIFPGPGGIAPEVYAW